MMCVKIKKIATDLKNGPLNDLRLEEIKCKDKWKGGKYNIINGN